jgi:hypothetical protein
VKHFTVQQKINQLVGAFIRGSQRACASERFKLFEAGGRRVSPSIKAADGQAIDFPVPPVLDAGSNTFAKQRCFFHGSTMGAGRRAVRPASPSRALKILGRLRARKY